MSFTKLLQSLSNARTYFEYGYSIPSEITMDNIDEVIATHFRLSDEIDEHREWSQSEICDAESELELIRREIENRSIDELGC